MRQRSRYTKSEITMGLFTTGSQWMTKDGTEYFGQYHTYVTGEIYTEPKWNQYSSVPLFPYREEKTNVIYRKLKDIKTDYVAPQQILPHPDTTKLKDNFIVRYFFQKINSSFIIESNEANYKLYQSGKIDNNLYLMVVLNWYIVGHINDENEGIAIRPGITTKNKIEVTRASKTMPDIMRHLVNYTEYSTDTDYVVPPAIN